MLTRVRRDLFSRVKLTVNGAPAVTCSGVVEKAVSMRRGTGCPGTPPEVPPGAPPGMPPGFPAPVDLGSVPGSVPAGILSGPDFRGLAREGLGNAARTAVSTSNRIMRSLFISSLRGQCGRRG